jgi:hypothetical protein
VLVCRLIGGKITFVHRRLWPAMIRLADQFAPEGLAKVEQEHAISGHHVNHETPFPLWADVISLKEAQKLTESQAFDALGEWSR